MLVYISTLGVSYHAYAKTLRKLKNGRAVSRFLFLNLSFIFATYPPAKSGQPLAAGIFGLAGPCGVP